MCLLAGDEKRKGGLLPAFMTTCCCCSAALFMALINTHIPNYLILLLLKGLILIHMIDIKFFLPFIALLFHCNVCPESTYSHKKSCIFLGTTAFLFITPDSILIAADSKQIKFENNTIISTDTVCKIREKENIFYAIAGIIESANPNISLEKVIYDIKFHGNNFESKVLEIKKTIRPFIIELAKGMRKSQPKLFNEMSKSGQFVSLILASFENKKPMGALLVYKINSVDSPNFDIIDSAFIKRDIPSFVNIGKTDALSILRKSEGNFSKKFKSTEELLNGLIELQSQLTPNDVGMPADIIKITLNKSIWVQKTAKCK
jgi:hypothetical protein